MDRFEHLGHQFHLGAWNNGEHVAVKVNGAALVLGFGEYLTYGFQHTQALVADHQLYALKAASSQPL